MRAASALPMLILVLGATMAGAQAHIAKPAAPLEQHQTVAFLPTKAVAPTPHLGTNAMLLSDISTLKNLSKSKASGTGVMAATETWLADSDTPDTSMMILVALAIGATVVRRSGGS